MKDQRHRRGRRRTQRRREKRREQRRARRERLLIYGFDVVIPGHENQRRWFIAAAAAALSRTFACPPEVRFEVVEVGSRKGAGGGDVRQTVGSP